jgi:hypothetical protein
MAACIAGCVGRRGDRLRLADELIEPAVEAVDQFGDLAAVVALAGFRRIGRGAADAGKFFDAAGEVVELLIDGGKFAAIDFVIVVVGTVLGRLMQDDVVQPFAQRHAGPARRFPCGLARFRPNAFYTPWHAKFHAHVRSRGGDAKSLDRLPWNRRALRAGGCAHGSHSTHRLFAGHGKQAVNFWPKCRILTGISPNPPGPGQPLTWL